MISLPPTVKIFLAAQPVDMRKSFDGLKAPLKRVSFTVPTEMPMSNLFEQRFSQSDSKSAGHHFLKPRKTDLDSSHSTLEHFHSCFAEG
jgi:hypothetical protein